MDAAREIQRMMWHDPVWAERELARQLHARRVVKALTDEPAGEIIEIDRLATPQHARLHRHKLASRHRLQEALNAGDDDVRP